ncbi:MAG: hypothetical protein R3B70_24230 [Polyangiaceae bacterium]
MSRKLSSSRPRRAAGTVAAVLGLVVLLVLAALWMRRAPAPSPSAAAAQPASSARARARARARAAAPRHRAARQLDAARASTSPPSLLGDPEARRARLQWTLGSYLDWSQYPPTSRPARERPDRLHLHASSPRHLPLLTEAHERTRARVRLWQSHAYLAGPERAQLTVTCERDAAPIPCTVLHAVVTTDPDPSITRTAPLPFTDDGAPPDRAAADGTLTADLAPAELGFADLTAELRVQLLVDAGGERGAASFVVGYTGAPPATFTGRARDELHDGSVRACFELDVRDPGRYLLDARIDDAAGETFAFVSFDGALARGTAEACFDIFGKLALDEDARAPFTVRDVEGFLLLEDAFPDRRSLPTWEGAAFTTRAYESTQLSEKTWESDTKSRHLAHLREAADPPPND